jgi:predicted nucleotidyltransferase
VFVDRSRVIEELRLACRRAMARRKDIEVVILFGSFARGDAGPRSDADLLVILADSPHERRMDRIPGLLEAFSPMPVPLDIVPWTRAELERARREKHPWVIMVQSRGIELA